MSLSGYEGDTFTSPRRKKRRNRPKNIGHDDTMPIFDDMPPLVWCPYTLGEHPKGHFAPVDAFGKNAARPSGLSTYCKPCRKIAESKYRKRANKNNVVRELRALRRRIEKAVERAIASFTRIEQAAK